MFSPKDLYLVMSLILAALILAPALPSSDGPSQAEKEVVLIGAGDIADCTDLAGAEATAKLLEANPGTVMALGDLAYPNGAAEDFKVQDGLVFNAFQVGDKVVFTATEVGGVKTITKLQKQ